MPSFAVGPGVCPNEIEPNFVGWVLAPLRVLADADPSERLIGLLCRWIPQVLATASWAKPSLTDARAGRMYRCRTASRALLAHYRPASWCGNGLYVVGDVGALALVDYVQGAGVALPRRD
ncbi:Uncharacterised protein [Mycobacteroides abscessus subsp. abscessus]|nr:Uncharacterised protein [Mycobacteroides abscessus subsp. abscessus]